MRKNEEHREQAALITRVRLSVRRYPVLELLFSVPNGGYRNAITAKILQAEGVRPGVPDLLLPVPRPPYCGLAIEMKSARGRLGDSQKWWRDHLAEVGWQWCMCRSAGEAWDALMEYIQQGGGT